LLYETSGPTLTGFRAASGSRFELNAVVVNNGRTRVHGPDFGQSAAHGVSSPISAIPATNRIQVLETDV